MTKPEGRRKLETRSPKHELGVHRRAGKQRSRSLLISDFGFLSGFGLRVSANSSRTGNHPEQHPDCQIAIDARSYGMTSIEAGPANFNWLCAGQDIFPAMLAAIDAAQDSV